MSGSPCSGAVSRNFVKSDGVDMKVFSSLGSIIGALALCMGAQSVQATVNCGYFNANRGFNGTMALQITSLSVPRDLPEGRLIYTQQFHQAGSGVEMQCDTASSGLTTYMNVSDTLGNSGSTANSTYANITFKTQVPGIGIVWWGGVPDSALGESAKITERFVSSCIPYAAGNSSSCRTPQIKFSNFVAVSLVKIGPIGSGTIDASQLGRLVYNGTFGDSATYILSTLSLRGIINVVSQTCQTPNVSVPMGSYKTSSFTGKGSVTPIVKFTIALRGCPGFEGRYVSGNDSNAASQNGPERVGAKTPNTLSIRIDPVSPPIDSANGILSVATGPGMATGVGVQLVNSSGAAQALATAINPNVTLANVINIGFAARYHQTADIVTAGKANAVATYTLIYQ